MDDKLRQYEYAIVSRLTTTGQVTHWEIHWCSRTQAERTQTDALPRG